jgi:histone H3/H4
LLAYMPQQVAVVAVGLPEGVFKRFQQTKDFASEAKNNLTESAHHAKESVTETAGKAADTLTRVTDKAVDAVTTAKRESVEAIATTTQQATNSLLETAQQTKSSLEQTLHAAGQLSSTTSEAIQLGINSSIDRWLELHPPVLRLVHLLLWAADRPLVSLVILLFAIAIAWSLMRAIGRLIDTVGWSLLQAPFKLGRVLIGVGWRLLGSGSSAARRMAVRKTQPPVLLNAVRPTCQRERLLEIVARLEAVQKEQRELLQEVASILNSDEIDVES